MKQPKCRLCGAYHYSYQPHSLFKESRDGDRADPDQFRPDDGRDGRGGRPADLEEKPDASVRDELPTLPPEPSTYVDGLHDSDDGGDGDRGDGSVGDLSLEDREAYRRVYNARMRPYMRKWRHRRKQQKSGEILIKDPE
jgi:hypothetical protein